MKFIGDVHGKFQDYYKIIRDNPGTFQVGDIGVGFRHWPHGEFQANPNVAILEAFDARFIRGNHDDPKSCLGYKAFIPDGTVIDDVMFIGGAHSVDWEVWDDEKKAVVPWRYDGYNGWSDEEISLEAIPLLAEIYKVTKPRVMCTHDCPSEAAKLIYKSQHKFDNSLTQQTLQAMLEFHQPEIWVHGHHHVSTDHILNGTRFICLAELEMKDV